jgi:hypothetical protein
MHPRQASLLTQASDLSDKTAAKKRSEAPALPSNPVLWKYEDPDGGGTFYLESRKMTVKSPFTGKSFTSRPLKHTPMQVGRDLKDEAKAQRSAPKTAAVDPWKA